MKRKWMLVLAAGLASGAAGFATNQGLVRLQPSRVAQERRGLSAEEIEVWRARLTDPDLDLREQAFAQAVAAVRSYGRLAGPLIGWAADEADPELAWTARLVLREARGRTLLTVGVPLAAPWGAPDASGVAPGRDPAELLARMRELHGSLEDLFAEQPPSGQEADSLAPPQGGSRAQGLKLSLTPDGVECEVMTEEDGQRTVQRHHAASIEELLDLHPELRGRIGASAEPPAMRTDILGVVVRPLASDELTRLGNDVSGGLQVQRVEPGTIAASLGVLPGHVLLELNGRALNESEELSRALAERPDAGEVRLILLDRYGIRRTRVWKPEPARDEGAQGIEPEGGGER